MVLDADHQCMEIVDYYVKTLGITHAQFFESLMIHLSAREQSLVDNLGVDPKATGVIYLDKNKKAILGEQLFQLRYKTECRNLEAAIKLKIKQKKIERQPQPVPTCS
jgi:hypothetical protein